MFQSGVIGGGVVGNTRPKGNTPRATRSIGAARIANKRHREESTPIL
jgi:hypothetical protein